MQARVARIRKSNEPVLFRRYESMVEFIVRITYDIPMILRCELRDFTTRFAEYFQSFGKMLVKRSIGDTKCGYALVGENRQGT